jgi:hypothetical protein
MAAPARAQQTDPWSSAFSRAGVHGSSGVRVTDALSEGDTLWVSGRFDAAGKVYSPGVARWDGTRWHAVGEGVQAMVPGEAHTRLVRYGADLVVAGEITSAGGTPVDYIAQWDGNAWHPMGDGFDGKVLALVVYQGDLIAGGTFDNSGSTPIGHLARWTGSAWEEFCPVGGDFGVRSLGLYQGDLIVSGWFGSVGGVDANQIARFDGTQWHALGAGIHGNAWAIREHGGHLWVGGSLEEAGGLDAYRVARWNGISWEDAGAGLPVSSPTARDFEVVDDELWVGLSGADGQPNVLRWEGTQWVAAFDDTLEGGDVYALEVVATRNELFVGGSFREVGGCHECDRAVVRDLGASAWIPLGSGFGLDGAAYALLESGGTVYAGGSFTRSGDVAVRNVLAWNGVDPLPLGDGLNGPVVALAEFEERVVAGGSFTASGGQPLERVAAWDGAAWAPLGVGFNDVVRVLAVHDGELYAGGDFTEAGGSPADRIARWDGSAWHAVGAGFQRLAWYDASVGALASWNGDLYAAGLFTHSGQEILSHVARWNGSGWVSVGRHGLETGVYALHVHENRLLAAGRFEHVEGLPASGLAEWDGTAWSPLGWPGETAPRTITTYHGDLVVAPVFSENYVARDIARRTDGEWTVYPAGVVYRAAPAGESVFFAGSLAHAGGGASVGLARLKDPLWESTPIPDRPDHPGERQPALRIAAPFRPGDALLVSAPPAAHTTVDLFDVAGRRVTRLFAGELPPGGRTLHWDGNTSSGAAAAGVYFVRLESAGGSRVEKLVLVR